MALYENINGGILLGDKILEEYENGRIHIDPFDKTKLNPNSYNVSIGNTLKTYVLYRRNEDEVKMFGEMEVPEELKYLDPKRANKTKTIEIPEDGYVLKPGILYLASTEEAIGSDYYVPMINGRSSIGRLGMSIHVTAGFGDIGFKSQWTLEITVVEPLKIYPGMEVAQVSFYTPYTNGDVNLYRGRYYNQEGPVESRYYLGKNYVTDED